MSAKTGIEWTDATWNPIRGCSPISPGCKNCYASKVAMRFSGPGQPYEGLVRINAAGERTDEWNGVVRPVEKHLLDPLRWKEPRRIFVNSMSDLFHENLPDEEIDKVFAEMALCPQHTFQVLTKRPERMLRYLNDAPGRLADVVETMRFDKPRRAVGPLPHLNGGERWFPLANVWLGVSVENQKYADERIPLLLQTPAAVRFISAEPLLGEVDLSCIPWPSSWDQGVDPISDGIDALRFQSADRSKPHLDWVIAGGESGPGARPMHPDWARSLRDQCRAADIPFFFKQWGEWTPGQNVEAVSGYVRTATWFDGRFDFAHEDLSEDEGHADDQPDLYRVGKKKAGAFLEGVEWKQFPEVRV